MTRFAYLEETFCMECFIFVGKLIPGIAWGSFEDKLEKV